MKKILLFIAILGLTFGVEAQTQHIDGETKLVNPSGRTLMIEKDDDDSWLTFHDPGQYWYSMGIDKSNSGSFSLNVGGYLNSSQFVMNSNGNIGIGTMNPDHKLDVYGNIYLNSLSASSSNNKINSSSLLLKSSGYATDNKTRYQLWEILSISESVWGAGDLVFNSNTDGMGNNEIVRFSANGNVGIGITTPDAKLAVNGNIHTKEVKVDLVGWPDFVFEKEYDLPTLADVENYIKEKGHLKDIPSAKDVTENGILLGEMDSKLLQKIEELTLYTINQEHKIKSLEVQNKEIQILKNENKLLWNRLNKIEELLNEKNQE